MPPFPNSTSTINVAFWMERSTYSKPILSIKKSFQYIHCLIILTFRDLNMCFSKENDHCHSNACVFQKQKLDHFFEAIHKVPHTIVQERNSKMVFMWILCYPNPLKNSRRTI
jgi:hypothetical protein